MTRLTPAGAALDAPPARPRPYVHFTADDGWINDPYGIVWTGERYHLFYQEIAGRVTWAPSCGWGHAESPDLVHWTELPPVLEPRDGERGCWSGSVVLGGPEPTLFYTRIAGDGWSIGSIVRGLGSADLREWSIDADPVIAGPPPELGVHTFRDPFVFRYGDEWRLVAGAGLSDGRGGALHYRSTDLRTWTPDGLLCSRRSEPGDDVWTGAMWECPQLFPLGDAWVLLVSVWDNDILYYTAAALGDYDGRQFVPRTWQRLTYGSCAYAMTAFLDRDSRRCVMSWLREEPQNDPALVARAGAHSVAAVVTRSDGDLLTLTPHPDVVAALGPVENSPAVGSSRTHIAIGPTATELTFVPMPGLKIRVTDGTNDLAVLRIDADALELRVTRPRRPEDRVPIAGQRALRLLFDADLLEVFGAGGYGAFRLDVTTESPELDIAGPHPEFALRRAG
jgi:beta-fructofuranosidase